MDRSNRHSVLKAANLAVGYRGRKAVTRVASELNFELCSGQLVALVGPNGIGKSTLLRTLSGVQRPLEGNIWIEKLELRRYSPLLLATRLSLVLTQPPASVNLSVRELVSLGRQPYTNSMGLLTPHDREIVRTALEQTETNELARRKCYELSDGQLQRVVIARALAQDTPLIVMDEPTTHLDLYHRAYILKLLKRLSAQNNKTILFSTHEIDLAIQVADKMLIMDRNAFYAGTPCQLIADGRFQQLFPEDSVHFDPDTGRFTIRN